MKNLRILLVLALGFIGLGTASGQIFLNQLQRPSGNTQGLFPISDSNGYLKYYANGDTAKVTNPLTNSGNVTLRQALRSLYTTPTNIYSSNGTIPSNTVRTMTFGNNSSILYLSRADLTSIGVFTPTFADIFVPDNNGGLALNGAGATLYNEAGSITANDFTILVTSNLGGGIEYFANYAARYTSLSLVHKGYVDSLVAVNTTAISNLVSLSGVSAGSTTLGTFTGSTIGDNLTVKQAIQALETAFEAAPTFYTNNGSLTSNRTVTGGGFSLAMTGVSSYTITLSGSNPRSYGLSTSGFVVTSDFLDVKNAVGASQAQAAIRLYEDQDNASPANYVGIQAPGTMTTNITWTLPNTDITTGSYFWAFNSSEVGSLVQWGTTIGNSNVQDASYGSATSLYNSSSGISLASGAKYIDYGSSGAGRVWTFIATPGTVTNTTLPLRLAVITPTASVTGQSVGMSFYGTKAATTDTMQMAYFRVKSTDGTFNSEDFSYEFWAKRNGVQTLQGTLSSLGNFDLTSLSLSKTVTGGGTTGNQTIDKATGSVNFAAAATSLTVTNSLVTANSIIICTIGTNDATMTSCNCVAGSGSFVINANAAATAETRVNFIVTN